MLKNFKLTLDLFATKKAGGNSKNGRDSIAKSLGQKASQGQLVKPGQIIFRQRGTRHNPGKNVMMGKDHTIFSIINGTVNYRISKGKKIIDVRNV
jgi:large subunit ribosomal protein L27